LLNVKHVSIVNLIAQKEVFPEFIQENCNETKIYNEVNRLITDSNLRHKIITEESSVIKKLQTVESSPSRKAALEVMRIKQEFK
jgi:lipid-A-disaccharide synthase